MHSLAFLRDAVLRREGYRDIDYIDHRDHSSHTVNNYLLGCIIYEESNEFRKAFKKALDSRFGVKYSSGNDEDRYREYFCHVWVFASLLHDIGYILEGSLPLLSTETNNERVRRGAEVLNDFFCRRFWFEMDTDVQTAVPLLEYLIGHMKELSKTTRKSEITSKQVVCAVMRGKSCSTENKIAFNFNRTFSGSLSSLADQLSYIGDTRLLLEEAKNEFSSLAGIRKEEVTTIPDNCRYDAFEIWSSFYKQCDNRNMADLMIKARNHFKEQIWSGIGTSSKVRTLDHGICSGLIQLQYTTYNAYLQFIAEKTGGIFFKMAEDEKRTLQNQNPLLYNAIDLANDLLRVSGYFGVIDPRIWVEKPMPKQDENGVQESREIAEKEKENDVSKCRKTAENGMGLNFWWISSMWGSAACALHNLIQDKSFVDEITKKHLTISLDDDPIAFLGIYVDILQEWDRYDVNPQSMLSGPLPLQGNHIRITPSEMIFPLGNEANKNVKDEMEKAFQRAFGKDLAAIHKELCWKKIVFRSVLETNRSKKARIRRQAFSKKHS
jgi:hypothetical protein